MYGRYGGDQLSWFLLAVYVLLVVLSGLPHLELLSWLALAVLFSSLSFAEAPIRRADGEEEDVLLEEALTVYFYGVAMGILNASLRLMRVTHFDVQAMLYRSSALFEELCRAALSTPLERMTGYAPMTEILSAFHVGARVRLFMS